MSNPFKQMEVAFETPSSLFGISLPKLVWKGTLIPSDVERRLAWDFYVELSTRIAVTGLSENEGSLREALNSYHSLFEFARNQIHSSGPDVGRPIESDELPIAALILWLLNGVIRPLTAKWHPRLSRYEETRNVSIGQFNHEAAWADRDRLYKDLQDAHERVLPFARLFERICRINPSLVPD